MKWERLIEARTHAGLTQPKLGKLMGVTKMTVLRWEALENFPDLHQLKELADILHCSIDWLLYNEPFVLQEKQYMDDLYDLAQAVLLWKSENGDKYPAGCEPQNEVGLVRYFSKKTNRKTGVEWAEVRKAIRGMQFLAAEDPILNSEAASQKRKRADAKKTKK